MRTEYTIPEKVYQYTASVQQELGGGFAATAAYVGSQGRNLFLRSVANQITQVVTNPNPANAAFVIREFSIVAARRGRQRHRRAEPVRRDRLQDQRRPRQLQRDDAVAQPPVGERPRDEHAVHARQAAAARRAARTKRTPRPTTPARSTQFDYDDGYNNFDVRHTFNVSLLYSLPYGQRPEVRRERERGSTQALLGGWDVGGIAQRPQRRAGPRADRPARTSSIATAPGNYLREPGGRPRGGHQHARRRRVAQRAPAGPGARRRSVHQGRRPAVPEPGGVRDAGCPARSATWSATRSTARASSRSTSSSPSTSRLGGRSNVEFRGEVFNLFDTVNFANPIGTLPQAIPKRR